MDSNFRLGAGTGIIPRGFGWLSYEPCSLILLAPFLDGWQTYSFLFACVATVSPFSPVPVCQGSLWLSGR